MKNWWKVVSVVLLAYTLYAGLTVPVGPGIAGVNKQKVEINPTVQTTFDLTIEGYNTHFVSGDSYAVWLKKDSFYICGKANALQANSLSATFTVGGLLPEQYNGQAFTLVILGATDGLFLAPGQVTLNTTGDSLQQLTTCEGPKGLTKASYFSFPYRNVLYETIRNLNYHVPMWFTMIALLFASFVYSIMYLNKLNPIYDIRASQLADVGILFGLLGITTGAFWARFTWGVFWSPDPKLNGAAIGVLIYLAYNILRSTINDPSKTGRLASVYNIMAFPIFIVLIIILPKVADFSLHPGSGDSVGFKDYDLDSNLRMVFYPAVLGWILLGFWIAQLRTRILMIKHKYDND